MRRDETRLKNNTSIHRIWNTTIRNQQQITQIETLIEVRQLISMDGSQKHSLKLQSIDSVTNRTI